MGRGGTEAGILLPAHYNIIGVVVEGVADDGVMSAFCYDGRGVEPGLLPVAAVIDMAARGVGQAQRDGGVGRRHSRERRLVSDGARYHVAGGRADGVDSIVLSVNGEMRVQLAVPYIECLMDVADVGRSDAATQRLKVEAYDAEMKTVGGAAEIVARVTLTTFLPKLAGVELSGRVMAEIEGLENLGKLVALAVRERMPAPLALSAETNAVLVVLGEGLQTRNVGGEGETSVAHTERRQCVESCHNRYVAGDKGMAVNLGLVVCMSRNEREKENDGQDFFISVVLGWSVRVSLM